MKTLQYIEEIKKKYAEIEEKPVSDYRVSQLLQVTHQTISQYKNKGTTFNDEVAAKAGALLDMPTYIVIADMHSERAKKKGNKEVMQAWDEITKKLTGTAAGILMTVAVALPGQVEAAEFNIIKNMPSFNDNIYYAVLKLLGLPLSLCRFVAHSFTQKIKGYLNPPDTVTTPAYI